jgi:type 1 fimbria pilin
LLTALGLLPFTTGAQPDSWNVEGAHGELHVYGEFVEGSCRVDMVSQTQEIDLGEISTQALRRVGDRGEPIAFTIRLRNCVRTGGHMLNARSGNAVWDPIQPVASITFLAPADADSPQLVQVKGVTGLGLRITDGGGRDVYLGDRSAPQFVTPASDALVYHVQPERTPAPLTPGKWQATVGFRLNYD